MTRFWNLTTLNESDDPLATAPDGVLDIDGEIVAEKSWFTGPNAIVAREFRKALAGVGNVTVHINSPGGDVMAGAEIYSALREHSMNGDGRVRVIVTALAASAASIIAMAGDEILMHPVAYMMIHNPWTVAVGNAKEIRKTAKVLDEIGEGLITAYERRTGKSRDELKRMLENETWMSAGTAVEEGFADGIYGADAGANNAGATGACASLARPTLMSAKAHGVQEILSRYRAADEPDEEEDPTDPPEEPEEEEPEEEEPEKPEEEEPEEPEEEEEAKKRAAIRERAEIAAAALAAAGY